MRGSAREPLGKVVVVGDGPTGLAAAIALRRAVPQCAVTVVSAPADPGALADRTATLTPRSNAFLRQIGIDEAALAVRAGGCPKLGVELTGWMGAGTRSVHAFGAAPAPEIGSTAIATALAEADCFASPSDDRDSPLSEVDYALRFSPQAYTRLLATLSSHVGIIRSTPGFAGAVSDGKGGIATIRLTDGATLDADLFIDCSGPSALVAAALPAEPRADWSSVLPGDRLLVADKPGAPQLTPLDRITATPSGWRAEVFGRDGTHAVAVTNAAFCSSQDGRTTEDRTGTQVIAIAPGRRARLWQSNVICIGDSGVQFEPLLWLNASLVHAQIELLLELLPGRDIHPLERDEFNRRAAAMADRVRDFVCLHYRAPRLPEGPFWTLAANLDPPESLSLTLGEFTRRGRLPFFEEDIMPRDAWISAMTAVGIKPGPTARYASLSAADRAALARRQEQRAFAAVKQALPYREWLAAYLQSAQ